MNDRLAKVDPTPDASAIELVLVQGDLSKLTAPQRVIYYNQVCESVGLNPLTRPFEYLNLNGALRLYARRDCTDQLRKIHNVSIKITARDRGEDVYVVTAQATFPNGRTDESTGAVPIANARGENLANALMKAETKAKRRVTLSICGLSMLDESELDGVRDQIRHPQPLQDPDGDNNFDQDVANDLLRRVHELEKMLTECDSYDKALALRAMLGTSDKRSQLTIDIQKAFDPQKPSSTWMITPEQHRELGRIWQSVHRKCAKLEKELAPSAEDVSHASGDFAGANREEHDHDPADDFDR